MVNMTYQKEVKRKQEKTKRERRGEKMALRDCRRQREIGIDYPEIQMSLHFQKGMQAYAISTNPNAT